VKAAAYVVLLLRALVVSPLFFYLCWWVLRELKATELVWFLFWLYVPLMLVCLIVGSIVSAHQAPAKGT
jgi:hypothetical protein